MDIQVEDRMRDDLEKALEKGFRGRVALVRYLERLFPNIPAYEIRTLVIEYEEP